MPATEASATNEYAVQKIADSIHEGVDRVADAATGAERRLRKAAEGAQRGVRESGEKARERSEEVATTKPSHSWKSIQSLPWASPFSQVSCSQTCYVARRDPRD